MILAIFLSSVLISAATPSANPKAQEILDRVSDKVSKIADQLKRVYVGKIKSVGTTSIVITANDGTYTISTSDATSFHRVKTGQTSEISFSNFKVGDDLAAIGTIDPSNSEMNARQIISKAHRYNVVGTIEESSKNVLTVKEFSGQITKVDISETPVLKKNIGTIFSNAKLSDFKVGSTVALICYLDTATSSLSALKAVIITL